MQKALHVDPQASQKFQLCNMEVNRDYQHDANGSFPMYPKLKEAGIRILKYSGDTDGAVPTWGTRQWINALDWEVKEAWRPWFVKDKLAGDQVGGYTTV